MLMVVVPISSTSSGGGGAAEKVALVVAIGNRHESVILAHLCMIEQQPRHQNVHCLDRGAKIEEKLGLEGCKGLKRVAEAVEERVEERWT